MHRDIKPENVLISQRGQIKVADFGLAKAITSQTSTATQGLLIGTVSYLPPELVMSGRADARSDVYSAGVVLFELLTGRKPHTGETPIQVAYAHVHNDVPPPSTFPTAAPIPPYLDALVARATARDAASPAARRQGVPVPDPPGAGGRAAGPPRRPGAHRRAARTALLDSAGDTVTGLAGSELPAAAPNRPRPLHRLRRPGDHPARGPGVGRAVHRPALPDDTGFAADRT